MPEKPTGRDLILELGIFVYSQGHMGRDLDNPWPADLSQSGEEGQI